MSICLLQNPALGQKCLLEEAAGGGWRHCLLFPPHVSPPLSLHPKPSVDISFPRDSPCGRQFWDEEGSFGTLWAVFCYSVTALRAKAEPLHCPSPVKVQELPSPALRRTRASPAPGRSPGKSALTATKCGFCSNFCYKSAANCPSPPVGHGMGQTCRMGLSHQ